jgi:hypothetical protein
MGPSVGDPGLLVPLDADELIEIAVRSLGLDDFGPDSWRAPYLKLMEAVEEEAGLHTLGRLMTRQEVIRCLRTRLLVAQARKDDPAVDQERVEAPIIICGPARSGTTILFELLAQDPRLRAPLAWEAIHPLPLPLPLPLPEPGASIAEEGLRPALAECEQEFWEDVQPEFAAIHELRAALPVECITIMAPDFHVGQWVTNLDVPGFAAWYASLDPLPAYEFHRSVLRVLQRGRPTSQWLLKSPVHLGSLEALFKVYPDARVIHTHRDPVKTIPSTVSTQATTRWLRTDHLKVDQLSMMTRLGIRAILTNVIEARETRALPDERIADVHFLSLMRDPVTTIRAAYEKLGLELADDASRRMRAYLDAKPRGKHGSHSYAAEDWGMRESELREEFGAYTDHYRIELED